MRILETTRAPLRIAQPFMAGLRGPQLPRVPSGTKEPSCRPSRDFFIWLTIYPAINGWAIVTTSPRDCQTPFAPIVHLKMNSGKESVTNAECGLAIAAFQSARGLAHSKTLRVRPSRAEFPPGFGLRRPSTAFPQIVHPKIQEKSPLQMRHSDCGWRIFQRHAIFRPCLSSEPARPRRPTVTARRNVGRR